MATPRTTIETMIRVRCSTSERPASYLGARKRAIGLWGAVSDDFAVDALAGAVGRRVELRLGLVVLARDRSAELADPSAHRLAQLGQALGAEDDQGDDQDHDYFEGSDGWHLRTPSSARVVSISRRARR